MKNRGIYFIDEICIPVGIYKHERDLYRHTGQYGSIHEYPLASSQGSFWGRGKEPGMNCMHMHVIKI